MYAKWLKYVKGGMLGGGVPVFVPVSAFAAEEAAGLPQLDITTWPNQLFWLVVTFTIGYIMIARIITPKISRVIDARQHAIADDLKSAKDASMQAAIFRSEYETALATARETATQTHAKVIAEAKAEAEAEEGALSAKLAKKIKTAETKLSKKRDEVLENLDMLASEVAVDAIKAVINVNVTKAETAKIVKKRLASG